jgi:hypothetical protein
MNVDALKIIEEIKQEIIKGYGLSNESKTRNNSIYTNKHIVLIQNKTTGDLKVKRNLR